MTKTHHNQLAMYELEEENALLSALVAVLSNAWRSGHAPEEVKEDALIIQGDVDGKTSFA